MNCRDLTEFLDSWLDGSLSNEEIAEFDRHLKLCPPCVHYIDGYKKAVAMGRTAGSKCCGSEAEVPEELIRAILAARGTGDSSSS